MWVVGATAHLNQQQKELYGNLTRKQNLTLKNNYIQRIRELANLYTSLNDYSNQRLRALVILNKEQNRDTSFYNSV